MNTNQGWQTLILVADWKNVNLMSERLATLGIMRATQTPQYNIVKITRCMGGFRKALNLAPP